MFWHIFSNRFKCLIRDKEMIFWTFLYPLVLASFFSLAFQNLSGDDLFRDIPIAVVNNAAYQDNAAFQTALASVSDLPLAPAAPATSGGTRLFQVTVAGREKAENLLHNDAIKGYIVFESGAKVVVKNSGIEQTILKEFMDSFLQTSSAYASIAQNPGARGTDPAHMTLPAGESYLQAYSPGRAAPNQMVIPYYALIAMASLFGGFWGRKEISDIQADLSPLGARLNLSPQPKLKALLSSFSASITLQFLSLLLLLGYLSLVLRVDFGDRIPYVLLVCLCGSILGVSYGAVISTVFKKEGMKTAGMVCLSMLLSFFAGLMSPTMKFAATQAAPHLSYINPANLLTDAFYSLYYYTTLSRFFLDITLLLVMSAGFFLIILFLTRRQKYASL